MIQGHTGVTEVTGGEIVRYFFIAHVVRFCTFLHVKKIKNLTARAIKKYLTISKEIQDSHCAR